MLFKSLSRHNGRWWLLVVAVLNLQVSLAADPDIIVTIEEPTITDVSTGIANLRGWAIGLATINKIELFIDGQYNTDIPSGAARADVGAAFPNYPNANKSGFSLAFPYTLLSSGSHIALVRAFDVNGLSQESSTTFEVARLDSEFIADPNQVSLAAAAVSLVGQEVVVSNLSAEGQSYDVRLRWRVASQQFEMSSVIQRSAAGLSIPETVTSSASGVTTDVSPASAPIVITLEEPSASFASNGIANLRGWAVGLATIDKIELFIDGQYSTDVPSGGTRNDVSDAFPDYPNSNASGFSMAFPYSELSKGSHTALVRAHDVNGLTQESSAVFNVVKLDTAFINDLANVNLDNASVSIQNEQIIISNFIADNVSYDVYLQWQTATQQFEMQNILTAGGSSKAGAARFLTQSTFGPTLAEINHLTSLSSYEDWINQQFAEPISVIHKTALADLWFKSCPSNAEISEEFLSSEWWHSIINGTDQLRQRVAFALSEIFVVSGIGPLDHSALGLADYYDVLTQHAFGNYRDLLKEVTLHPAMGIYLSMLRNEKANPELNIRPDENYAREVLQLFSIGVHELNHDGSVKRTNGDPIPNYTQDVIEGFAKVFTGWNFANLDRWDAYIGNGDLTQSMVAWPEYHDSENDKLLLNNIVLPAGGTAEEDLDAALDNIFNHPNVAPFISKQLIQRLITSNPTPSYIQRIAQVFNNNGSGVKGDLRAVIRSILLDDEARTGHTTIANFGKLREPLLQLSHLRRALNGIPVTLEGPRYGGNDCGRGPYQLYLSPVGSSREVFGQSILLSPSVFNFFLPDYSPPGVVRGAGLVAPEFQINTENTMVGLTNYIGFEIQRSGDEEIRWATLNLSREIALASEPEQLLDHLDLLLLSGSMSAELRQLLFNHLNNDLFTNSESGDADKVKDAIMIIFASPDYLIQK